jgi:hypothetical protein
MGSGGYEVVIDELVAAASEYASQSANVQRLLKEWESAAKLDKSVFGNLATSAKIASEYENFHKQVSDAVTKLQQSLASGASTMQTTAAHYAAAEGLTQQYAKYVAEVAQDNKYLDRADSGKGP